MKHAQFIQTFFVVRPCEFQSFKVLGSPAGQKCWQGSIPKRVSSTPGGRVRIEVPKEAT